MASSWSARLALIVAAVLVAVAGLVCAPFQSVDDSSDASAPAVNDASGPETSMDAGSADALASRYASRILADRPIGYWRFEETSGTVAHDSSGHGHDGTYGSSVALGESGLVGEGFAAKFDGSQDAGVSHFVRVPEVMDLEPSRTLTVECWVKTPGSGASLVSYGLTARAPYESYDLWTDGAYVVANDAGAEVLGPATSATTGEHYFALVYDGAMLRFHIDDAPPVSTPASGPLGNYDTVGGLGIGSTFAGNRDNFDGIIDEVAIYDAALTPAQLLAHYQMGRAPP